MYATESKFQQQIIAYLENLDGVEDKWPYYNIERISDDLEYMGYHDIDEAPSDVFISTLQRYNGEVINYKRNSINYWYAEEIMDSEILDEMDSCNYLIPYIDSGDWQFLFEDYAERHERKFGTPFAPWAGLNW